MLSLRPFQRTIICWGILVTAVLIPFFLYEREITSLIDAGLAIAGDNTFLIAAVLFFVLASDIFLPVPSCLVGTLCGLLLGPWMGFAVSFAAMSVSAAVGYLIGRFFASLAQRFVGDAHARVQSFGKRQGPRLLLLFRPVPVLAECSAVYAGLRRWPAVHCAVWLTVGNVAVSAVYVAIGQWGRAHDSPLPAFAAVALLSAISFFVGRR